LAAPPLAALQAAFAAAVDGDPRAAAAMIRAGGLAPAERLAIYANNAWSSYRRAMELSFPAVRRLGGDDWFVGAVREYRRRHPSRSGNLQGVGAAFPAFLGAELAGTPHEVFADVAALEWAYQEVLVAPDAPPLDLARLAAVPEADYPRLVFVLHPACRVFASRWPAVAVWRGHRDPDDEAPAIDLDAGPERVLLRRRELDVELHPLAPATHAFLAAFARGAPLAEAAADALAVDPAFDLGVTLRDQVALGVLHDLQLGA
jgi:hypothetical protein